MRKLLIVPAGLAAAAIVAAAGIGVAGAATAPSAERQPSPHATAASTGISRSDAERAALAAVPGSTVIETRLDGTVWNVHLSTSDGTVEVKVDARSGAVRLDDDARGRVGNDGIRGQVDNDPATHDPATHDAREDHGRANEPGDDHGHGDGPGHH